MAVVIRLQGLRVTAGSEDIRSFFTGLRIPDGGVHIIGGELEEAFIIFVSDEDARRAMSRSGGCIKGSPVNLLLSSKTEMQKVLEESTRKAEANNNRRIYKEGVKRPPAAEGRPPPMNEDVRVDMRRGEPFQDSQNQMGEDNDGFYLHLSGMPFAASQEDVRMFFKGLQVEDMNFLNNRYGMFNGICLVKFATTADAREGLKLDRQYMGSRYICIKVCSEEQWVNAGGFVRPPVRARSRSPVRSRSRSPTNEEYCVLYENLSALVQKRDIKALIQPVFLKDDQIIIFAEQNRENTHSAVVVFRNLKDYCSGLAHHKEMFLNRVVFVSPISKEKMMALLETSTQSRDGRRSSRSSERSQKSSHDSEKRCLYVRNLPFDVRKVEIMDFFHGFQLSEDTIILLHDERGAGLGEVLIVFQTEEEAMMAQSLNGQRFLGSQVILKCITLAQMQAFGVSNEIVERSVQRNPGRRSDPPPHSPEQMNRGDRDMMPDRPYFGQGNSSQFDSFENNDFHGPGTQWSGPQQYGPPDQQFDGPTCLKLLNLPSQIGIDEIYDFCYGFRVIPGSVSLQYDRNGVSISSATVVFETHGEAVTAIEELNGRPIGTRKIKIVFV
ncbi:RNA binding motif protein 12Bb [Astyanax mexicanus]|uniref:RNA binding motif protein 12Bb n=1 Tax=Astyanax mexicanus TaxID=7994 RepID=A0A3B1JYJ1_ASTMX|nr:RNA binding motif protein 12Bb [Astyanax mexicanus]XP_015463145.2 RNA binding motif protein 12Bb [Astyanax mexicanus]